MSYLWHHFNPWSNLHNSLISIKFQLTSNAKPINFQCSMPFQSFLSHYICKGLNLNVNTTQNSIKFQCPENNSITNQISINCILVRVLTSFCHLTKMHTWKKSSHEHFAREVFNMQIRLVSRVHLVFAHKMLT